MDLDKTFHLQLLIRDIISDTLYSWDNERSRLCIESFKKKTHCLVLIKLGEWSCKNHYFKCGMILKPDQPEDLQKLKDLLWMLALF